MFIAWMWLRRVEMLSVSYAFLRSRKTAAVYCFFAKPSWMSEVRRVRLSMVLRPGRKPDWLGDRMLCDWM